MGRLKTENVKKCMSLLEEFISGSREESGKKRVALLALDQLHRVTAGVELMGVQCVDRPRADIVL